MHNKAENIMNNQEIGFVRKNLQKTNSEIKPEFKLPLVSVIIPSYNHAHFLSESIESVKRQTYRNVEIIVVDDGSKDNTPEIASKYPEVIYIRQDNRGLSAARNTGINKSNGHFLVFLDADDRLLPTALEANVNCFKIHPESGFVFGSYGYITHDGVTVGMLKEPEVKHKHYHALLQRNYIGMIATVMFCREILDYVGYFDTSLRASEDYDLFLRIARSFSVNCHAELVAEYRFTIRSMSCNNELMLKATLSVLRSQWRYVKSNSQYKAKYKIGIRFWKKYYGTKLCSQVLHMIWSRERFEDILNGVVTMIQHIPLLFVKTMCEYSLKFVFRKIKLMLPKSISIHSQFTEQDVLHFPDISLDYFSELYKIMIASKDFAHDTSLPFHLYYFKKFLTQHENNFGKRVLYILDSSWLLNKGHGYIDINGAAPLLEKNKIVTIFADLNSTKNIPSDSIDSVILASTLKYSFDIVSMLRRIVSILKPGGIVFAAFPGNYKNAHHNQILLNRYLRFSIPAVQRLYEEVFSMHNVNIETYGNSTIADAIINGLTIGKFSEEELAVLDPLSQVTIVATAKKPMVKK